MRVVFLPVRGSIQDSFEDSNVFNSIKEMFSSLSEHCPLKSLSISYYCFDSRFSVDCYIVCTTQFDSIRYEHPQAVGFVYFGLTKSCMRIRLNNFFNK